MSTDVVEGGVPALSPGVAPMERPAETEQVQVDYFGLQEVHRVPLPDGKSWVEHTTFTEGMRRKYLNSMNRDIVVQRNTGDAKMSMKPGDERFSLLMEAITGWNLIKDGKPLPFSKDSNGSTLAQFLAAAPPKIIDVIEKDVRMKNAWLLEDMSIEDMEKERDTLDELIAKKREEQAGNASS